MSDAISALDHAQSRDGIARIQEMGPVGMILLRADLSRAGVKKAVSAVTGLEMPGALGMISNSTRSVCWMSPDEVLLIGAYGQAYDDLAKLTKALGKTHALAVNVSDARAVFQLSGDHARDVLAKLTPVDLRPQSFAPGTCRRTRLAQVAAAIWMRDATTFEIVCFRSVAQYMFDVLTVAAQPGSEVNLS